jgi:hypothetical protein
MVGRIISKSGGEFSCGYWRSFQWMPDPELATHVRRYNGYFESSARPVRRRELPSGEVALIISLGPHCQLIDSLTGGLLSTLRTFVAGLDDSYSVVEPSRRAMRALPSTSRTAAASAAPIAASHVNSVV